MGKWGWGVILLLGLNVVFLDAWVLSDLFKKEAILGDRIEKVIEEEKTVEKDESNKEDEDSGECDKECVSRIIDEKIAELVSEYDLATKKEVKTALKTTNTPVAKSTPKPTSEKFVRVSGGEGQGEGWMRLGETVFWLDTALYGELVEASWQGWLTSSGGSLDGWVRLFDASNGRAVDGSETRVTGLSKTSFYSSNIALWRGQNQYYIEVKDLGGGDKLTISEPRVRLMVR
jgi:hypothetical protein